MSISSEISRISGNVSAALTAIGNKGVTVPAGSNSDDLATLIASIQTGSGGVSRETIVPATTVSATAGDWARLTTGNTPSFTEGEYYAYTINGVERVATATSTGNNIYLSDIEYDWGGDGFAVAYDTKYGGIWFNASATSGEYTVKVDKLTLSGGGGGGDDWEYTWEYESGSAIIPLFMTGTATDETDSLLIAKPQLTLPFGNSELEVVAKMGVTKSSLPQFGAATSANAGFKVFFQADTGYVRSNATGSYANYTADNGFHKIKMKWQNGTATLYVDDVQVASGSGGTSSNFNGIGVQSGTNMNAEASMYFKSIKYRRL